MQLANEQISLILALIDDWVSQIELMHPFELIYERAERVFDNWESWFDPAASADVYPDDLIHPIDEAIAMLERGETLWSHPGWLQTLGQVIHDWSQSASTLIRLRLTCEWLSSTLPQNPLDSDLARRIRLIAAGDWCEAFCGLERPIHRDPDASMRELKWGAAGRAIEWRSTLRLSPERIRQIQQGK
ncbi:MAG: hypothetical protein SNJ50_21525 [Cyanobacteriota bacterium]